MSAFRNAASVQEEMLTGPELLERAEREARDLLGVSSVDAAFDMLDLVLDSNRTPTADAVLNGIAYDSTSGSFLVTGKLWSKLYRVRFPAD